MTQVHVADLDEQEETPDHAQLKGDLDTYFRVEDRKDARVRSLQKYLGDVSYFDPTILKAYDETLTRIDGAVGEAN